jgi:hypothetical protein
MFRIVVRLLGVGFLLQGIRWVVRPAQAAASLGMPLLDGIARSSEVGDMASFFLAAGVTMLLGSVPGRARLLYFPAGLVGGAAVARTLAWAFHDAAFASTFVPIEVAVGAVLVLAARVADADT